LHIGVWTRESPDGTIPSMKPFLTRRSVLHGGSMLAVSSLLPGGMSTLLGQGGMAKSSPIKLGIASYTFRNFDQAHLIGFMKELKSPWLNLKDMHLPMTPADTVKERANVYRAAGFTLTAAGTIYFTKDEDDDIRSKFEYAKNAGIPIMVCMPDRAVLPRLEKFVKEYNIKLAIHNHGPEDKNFPSPLDVLAAVKDLDPRIGLCIDIGHTMRAGTDVVDAIHKAGPRLFDLHVKDLAKSDAKDSQVAVGEGIMPIPQIFKALIDQRYGGYVDLEYEIHADDPMPGVVKSFAYMRSVLAGMGYKA
jgi:sugar phosphate isomerase/epimerase